jgi:hypothetical protein
MESGVPGATWISVGMRRVGDAWCSRTC